MTKEVWRDVVGYEGLYEVSNLGNVNKLVKYNGAHKPRKLRIDKYGYKCISLWKKGKSKHFTVHRLVAMAFIPNPNELPCINHKDEDRANNAVENLEWCTVKYNSNYGGRNEKMRKIHLNHPSKSKPVECIETGKTYPSINEAQRQTGIFAPQIRMCCLHPSRTARKTHWKFI